MEVPAMTVRVCERCGCAITGRVLYAEIWSWERNANRRIDIAMHICSACAGEVAACMEDHALFRREEVP